MIWTKNFWKQTAERAIKSFCQGLLVSLTANVISLFNIDWKAALGAAGLYTLYSILTSIGSSITTQKESPSLVSTPAE
jgi:hypothetical protein